MRDEAVRLRPISAMEAETVSETLEILSTFTFLITREYLILCSNSGGPKCIKIYFPLGSLILNEQKNVHNHPTTYLFLRKERLLYK